MEIQPFLTLGSEVIEVLTSYWLRRQKRPDEPLADFLAAHLPDPLDRRRLNRRLESLTEIVAAGLAADPGDDQLDVDSRSQVVDAVRSTLYHASLLPSDLEESEYQQGRVLALIHRRTDLNLFLDEREQAAHDLLLARTVAVLLTAAALIPPSSPYVVAELLRDEDEIGNALRARLGELPSGGVDSYRLAVVTDLDQAEIVGFTLPAALRRFSLSRTYSRPRVAVRGEDMPVEWALADFPRLFLTGPAGSGKSALLQWLAVDSARKALDGLLESYNGLLPIYLPGSRLGELPTEEPRSAVDFILQYARPSLRHSMAPEALDRRCLDGGAILLLDGLDEFGHKQLPRIRHWVTQLAERYPKCRFVVATRPGAIDPAFFTDLGFTTANLNPLDDRGMSDLVSRWFAAVGPAVPERSDRRTPVQLSQEVVRLVRSSPQLRELSSSPLMCTLICGVYLDRGSEPLQGSEIYAAFVEMMIERRDVERGLGRDRLPRSLASIFLEELAGFMLRNGRTELPIDVVLEHLENTRSTLTMDAPQAEKVLNSLLVESGVLVEPERGRVRFLHLTFLEYLAAQHFLHDGDLNMLIARAHEPLWRATLVMAVTQARHREGDRLVAALAERIATDTLRSATLASVLEECVRGARRLNPGVRDQVKSVRTLLAQRNDKNGSPWQLWLNTSEGAVSDSLAAWLLAEPSLRREGGLAFAEGNPKVVGQAIPSGMAICLFLLVSSPIATGDLVAAIVSWRDTRPDAGLLELALVVPESALTVRISPSV
ncbi:NACHT domain-containing protein [Actinoplanes derwentensis]|uniref:NACHT domain-containing protein n=1 Tax=Actinoplanes derwentensis TaxID=113562 RepID=A0A1H2DDG1_9ACTN|nr:NACHT domain-containing protein [Actinoplanes derwentensis]GID90534.1 hypothetical protein Ade03nite_94580 [Actinoplanes derwentensis]SDT80627.1 NACHT domain-containing protein [Actinoplanes derwentensis]